MNGDAPTMEQREDVRRRPGGFPALRMRWEDLLFAHWRTDPDAIQMTLPRGLTVDTFDGSAWVAVVPFLMRRVHPVPLPCVPGLSDFLELNVRTYVHDESGVPGVWFYSLSCNQPLAVACARTFFHLNYVNAAMSSSLGLGGRHYACARGGLSARLRYRATGAFAEAVPGSIEFFVAERYVLFSASPSGKLFSGRVHHRPYQLAAAEVDGPIGLPIVMDRLPDPARPPDHLCAARPLDVDAWLIRRVE